MNRSPITALSKIKTSFRAKIYVAIVLVVILSGMLVGLSVIYIITKAMSEEYKSKGSATASTLAARSVNLVLAVDFLRLKNLLDETATAYNDILYIFITDEHGDVISHTFKGGFPVELKKANNVTKNFHSRVVLLTTGKDTFYDFAVPICSMSRHIRLQG